MTKRFATALAKSGRAALRSKFVIPDLSGAPQFIELATGRPHKQAVVVYTGRELAVADVLEKLGDPPANVDAARALIAEFLVQLRGCPIGSVISVRSDEGRMAIHVDAARMEIEPTRRLP